MLTAKDAWNEANKRYEDYLVVVVDGINDACKRGDTSVIIEFKNVVSSMIINKIKEQLIEYGYSVVTKDSTDETIAVEICWEVEK